MYAETMLNDMEDIDCLVARLKSQISEHENALKNLKDHLATAEQANSRHEARHVQHNGDDDIVGMPSNAILKNEIRTSTLKSSEYSRYGRQMIMPEVGMSGQLALKQASILIVGLGGLGCPAAAYLAGAGIGKMGLIDGDIVELSNLHRQIIHDETWIGKEKVDSVAKHLQALNSEISIIVHHDYLTSSNAVRVIEGYDIILDCTDRPSTRYLISDAANIAGKCVVTAAALRTEGQMMVLNDTRFNDRQYRFCYRCVFPKPPPAESVLTCGEGGILGPVVGAMGVLMAMETLKIILHGKDARKPTESNGTNGKSNHGTNELTDERPSLLLYSAYTNPSFRSVRLRGKRKDCISCSDKPVITRETLASGLLDYDEFCGILHPTNVLSPTEQIAAAAFNELQNGQPHIVVDVREKVQFDICQMPNSINLPFSELSRDADAVIREFQDSSSVQSDTGATQSLYFVCRFGNDSQLAVQHFKRVQALENHKSYANIYNIKGGLKAWREEVDPDFPDY